MDTLKDLFSAFCKENKAAFEEYRNLDLKEKMVASENLEKGRLIFEELALRKSRVDKIICQMYDGLGLEAPKIKQYKINKN